MSAPVSVPSAHPLLIFAKAPRPGLVKSRLAAAIGPEPAARASRTLLDRLVSNLQDIAPVVICHSPDDAGDELRPWLQPGWELEPQGPGDLGERLSRSLDRAFASGAQKVVVVGSDCPYVDAADVRTAVAALDRVDLVLGPARDGGYWLIGMRQTHRSLFRQMEWSTATVLAETLQRSCAAGLSHELLRELEDVDTLEAWERFLASSRK